MTDRQPGAPGQYKMVMNGVEYTVTLTRDDQPLVEGTPLNKATMLPDTLAGKICPGVTDPTPADALEGLRKKKVSATLFAANWEETESGYSQTLVISTVRGDDNESIRVWPVYSGNKETDEKIRDAAAEVTRAESGSGMVKFVCLSGVPDADIPVMVEVSR